MKAVRDYIIIGLLFCIAVGTLGQNEKAETAAVGVTIITVLWPFAVVGGVMAAVSESEKEEVAP